MKKNICRIFVIVVAIIIVWIKYVYGLESTGLDIEWNVTAAEASEKETIEWMKEHLGYDDKGKEHIQEPAKFITTLTYVRRTGFIAGNYILRVGDNDFSRMVVTEDELKKLGYNEKKYGNSLVKSIIGDNSKPWKVVLIAEKPDTDVDKNGIQILNMHVTSAYSNQGSNDYDYGVDLNINSHDADLPGFNFANTIEKVVNTIDLIADLAEDPSGTIGTIIFNIVRDIADGIQMLANLFQTIPEGTAGDITYSYNELKSSTTKSNKVRNEYTNVNEYVKAKSKKSWQKVIPEKKIKNDDEEDIEQFPSSAKIPVIQVDIYNIASGKMGIFDVNFFVPNDEIHQKDSPWYAIRDIVVATIRITIYIAAACLLTSLIWHGFNLVKGTLTPESRKKHMEGMHKFTISLLMLVGTVVIMAIGIYANEMFLPKINDENTSINDENTSEKELPIRVNVEEANYSFSTNPTGYIRYVAGIENHELCGRKIMYTSAYFALAIINLIAAIAMIARTIGMWGLSILGPIIAALHILNLDSKFKIKYQDWVKWYLTLSMVQVILALISKITLDIIIIN